MIIHPGEVEMAIESVPEEGFARVQGGFDPTNLLIEARYPDDVWRQGWEGDSRVGGPVVIEEDMAPYTRIFAQELGKIAASAGFPGWNVNRYLEAVTTEGMDWHADRRTFTDFVVLAYLFGRTDMFLETKQGKPKGLVVNPGDLLIIGAGTHHGVRPSRLRGYMGFAHQRATVDPYPYMPIG